MFIESMKKVRGLDCTHVSSFSSDRNPTDNTRHISRRAKENEVKTHNTPGRSLYIYYTIIRGGVLPYMGYIGMCGLNGYGFCAVLVINRVSILADFGHIGHK